MLKRVLLVLGAVVLLACSPAAGEDQPPEPTWLPPGTQIEAELPFWAVLLPVSINGLAAEPFLLDTGADAVLLSPQLAAQVEGETIQSLELGDRSFTDVPFSEHDTATASGLLGRDLGGILGNDLLSDLVLAIDYKRSWVYALDALTGEESFGPHVAGALQPFEYQTGSRNLLHMSLYFEDLVEPWPVIIDTGTSSAVISESLYNALGAATDGRTVLAGSKAIISGMTLASPIIRIESCRVGDRASEHMWATMLPDNIFSAISGAVGTEVSAIVGGAFLREFLLAIDYPSHSLRLAPYTDLDHIHNEFQRAGIEVFSAAGAYLIYAVFEGTDAQSQGIAENDVLLEIDGQSAAALSLDEVYARIEGEPGTTVNMVLEHEGQQYSVDVLREDLLPEL